MSRRAARRRPNRCLFETVRSSGFCSLQGCDGKREAQESTDHLRLKQAPPSRSPAPSAEFDRFRAAYMSAPGRSRDFVVTNKRVMMKVGVFNSRSVELLLNKIEAIAVNRRVSSAAC